MKRIPLLIFLSSVLLTLLLLQCNDNLSSNPDPAVLRIYLVTNPADTSIKIGFDSLTVTNSDNFTLTIGQMKIYSEENNYAKLFMDFSGYKDVEVEYNLLQRKQGKFVPQKIAETYIPPNIYKKVEFVVYPPKNVTIHGLTFPIEIPDDYEPLIGLDLNFKIDQNEEYDIYIRFNAFQSITRWRDTYIFTPIFEILNNRNG